MNSREYQKIVAEKLRTIFNKDLVKTEWDSVKYDGHTTNHVLVYAPRHDIVVGPFNSYAELDIGIDRAKQMRSHPFAKRLLEVLLERENLDKVWNPVSRCFLAIEIEFSGSSKHMLGSIINACASGSIGIVITTRENTKKVRRLCSYLRRLQDLERIEIHSLWNLIVFEADEFIDLIKEF